MKDTDTSNSQGFPQTSAASHDTGFTPWQRLKRKNISYLTLPLLVMATVTEFVILATGWKYQQVVCLPAGMGVTFFGIGPIGATILAVELLKLPLAIWTASRAGWQKGVMVMCGLPLICLLTFQLVKDMAVYEMGVAMTPAAQFLDQAMQEETKINQLNGELQAIEQKKSEREAKLAELDAKQAKAKADIADNLKRNDDSRQDAVSLTDYQKKELADVESREATIIQQFNADTAELNKSLGELRARREIEVGRSSKWNAEEARLDNDYKARLSDYTNKKNAYDKEKAEYDAANFLKRAMLKVPIDPGVPPQRQDNTILKPTAIAEVDTQIKAKEDELLAVNNKRRDRIAQVESEAHQLREDFDKRSSTKREEVDQKRNDLLAAQAKLGTEYQTERNQIDQDLATSVQRVDGIRAELDAARKKAEGYYEARESAIRKTQVHRIATTVEIVRGLIKGERPMSIKSTAKERGDILTDQISMVRIWVYPVLAFIVAFLPTLLVEIGFSTVFHPEKTRPAHRLGFLGRRLHSLYIRAGRQKILRAERLASRAGAEIASREKALATATAMADKVLVEKELELQAAHQALDDAKAKHEHTVLKKDEAHVAELKAKEEEWVAKLATMADSLNRTVIEKDAMRDLQKSEIERQISLRQNAWADRISQLRQELDDQRASVEAERTAVMQDHHKKLLEMTEDCKTQVIQARRQAADAEMAAVESTAKLTHELKEAVQARDTAQSQLQQLADSFSLKLSQAKEDAAREIEKQTRQEKQRLERQQTEFIKTQREREEDFEHQIKQREQELNRTFNTRLTEEQNRISQEGRDREADLERQFTARAADVETRWKQELQQREDAAQIRLRQREQQLQAQAEQELRRVTAELERQRDTQSREANARLKQELQQKELTFQAKLKQREEELTIKAAAREAEVQNNWASELRTHEEEWERQAEARIRATEARVSQEAKQKEEIYSSKSRQREEQWQAKLDAVRAELQVQAEEALHRRESEAEIRFRDLETKLRKEMAQREDAFTAKAKQREQELEEQLTTRAEARFTAAQAQWQMESESKLRAAVDPLKAQLTRAEKERDEAKEASFVGARQVQVLERKLTEASTFLSGWRVGNGNGNANGNANGKHLVEAD